MDVVVARVPARVPARSSNRLIARLSWAGVRTNRGRFASLTFAIFIGVLFIAATLTITDTVKAGFSSLFSDAYRNVSVVVREESEVVRESFTFRGRIDADVVDKVLKVEGVQAGEPRISGYAYVVSSTGFAPPNVSSETAGAPIAENWLTDPGLNPYTLVAGTGPVERGDVVIDRGTALAASIGVGDRVSVVTQNGRQPAKVVGIVRFGSVDSPGAVPVALFGLADAEALLGEAGRIDEVMVRGRDGISSEVLARSIGNVLPPRVEAVTGQAVTVERENAVAASLRFVTAFLLIFAVLSLVVGAFIIANTFSISIGQRTRELALLRALGGSRKQIAKLVMGEAAVMSVVGSVLGLLGGIGLARAMKSVLRAIGVDLPPSPLVVRGATVAWSLGIGIAVTLLAAAAPARRAARISPVAALRDSEIEPPPLFRRTLVGLGALLAAVVIVRRGASLPSLSLTGLGVGLAFLASITLSPAIGSLFRFVATPVKRTFGTTAGLAVGNATRNPRRTAASALALAMGSAVACFALILNASLSDSLRNAVGGGLRGDIVVRSGAFGVGGLPTSIATKIGALDSVSAVSGLRYGFATVDGPKRAARKASAVRRTGGRPIASLDPRSADRLLDFGREAGRFADLGKGTIAVSVRELDDRGWQLGDTLILGFPGREPAPFRIVAVFRQGIAFDFAVAHEDYEKLVPDLFDFVVYVAGKDDISSAKLRTEIEAVVADIPTAKVEDPKQYVARITSSLDQLLSLIFGLLVLVVAVAVLGIAITLSLSIVERVREIAMLRTLGMFRSQVKSMLRSEAIIISLLAVTIGVGLGIGASWGLLQALRDEGLTSFSIPPTGIALLAGLAAMTGLIASIVPGRRAARLPLLSALSGLHQSSAPRSRSGRQTVVRRLSCRLGPNRSRVVGIITLLSVLTIAFLTRLTDQAPSDEAVTTTTTTKTEGPSIDDIANTIGVIGAGNEPYRVPSATGPTRPGTLREALPITAPAGSKAWRVLFDSQLRDDRDTVVSGLVFAPDRPAPIDGWPVLSFAHPTTGLADTCAPSRNVGILETTIASLALKLGVVVVASDYPGLGTEGPHPFLDGVSSGRSVLDIARAASAIEGLRLSPKTMLWGHSQGGHAALFAAEQAPTYAPELVVAGVVAGAPPTQLRELLVSIEGTPDRGYALLVAEGLRAIDPTLKLTEVFTPRGIALAARLGEECSGGVIQAAARDTIRVEAPVPREWLRDLDQSQPGQRRIAAPVLIIHGENDTLIPVETSARFEKQLRAAGTPVERIVYPGAGHGDVALTSLTDVLAWIAKRLP